MPVAALYTLALSKGFAMRKSRYQGFQLIENMTQLPELNQLWGTTYFSLQEAVVFLGTVPDRRQHGD